MFQLYININIYSTGAAQLIEYIKRNCVKATQQRNRVPPVDPSLYSVCKLMRERLECEERIETRLVLYKKGASSSSSSSSLIFFSVYVPFFFGKSLCPIGIGQILSHAMLSLLIGKGRDLWIFLDTFLQSPLLKPGMAKHQ